MIDLVYILSIECKIISEVGKQFSRLMFWVQSEPSWKRLFRAIIDILFCFMGRNFVWAKSLCLINFGKTLNQLRLPT